MVEEMVEEVGGGGDGKWREVTGQEKAWLLFRWLCLLEKGEGRKIMKEREDGSVNIYICKGVNYYNIAIPFLPKRDLRLY